jgi:hypothetical protein
LKNSKLRILFPEEFQAENPVPRWRIPAKAKLKTLYPWRIPSSKPFTLE